MDKKSTTDSTRNLMEIIAKKAEAGLYSDQELVLGQLMVISKALVEIRDELRRLNNAND